MFVLVTQRSFEAVKRAAAADSSALQAKIQSLADKLDKMETANAALKRASRTAVAIAYDLSRDPSVSVRSRDMSCRVMAALSGVIPEGSVPPVPSPTDVAQAILGHRKRT